MKELEVGCDGENVAVSRLDRVVLAVDVQKSADEVLSENFVDAKEEQAILLEQRIFASVVT